MEKLTVAFIFNRSLNMVMMLEKTHGYFVGKLNGIGGHVEDTDESSHFAALRELNEEAGATEDMLEFGLEWLVTCTYPNEVVLNVYYGVLRKGEKFTQMEDELLMWYPCFRATDDSNGRIAGDGNTQYFVHAARVESLRRSVKEMQ